MGRVYVRIDEAKLYYVLRKDPRMGRYFEHVGNELRNASIAVFNIANNRRNEYETSEFTPPKYIASFRVRVYQSLLRMHMVNEDPGWHLVEWGAHPGGDPETFVLRYKPLTRGLIIVGARFRGR